MKLQNLLQNMEDVAKKIGTSIPYITGGAPRDRFLGHLENISDLDITTGDKTVDYLSQEFYLELRKKYNIKREIMKDGHSTIFLGSLKLDFSSNFNVPNIDLILKNQKNISHATNMQKEMFSRDFTCNALLLSFDLKTIIDPTHQSFNDLNKKIIKTCLSPDVTLLTNRNRVIRSIYLATKLDFSIDSEIINFVNKNPQSVKISTNKVLNEKLHQSFLQDPDKASFYLTQMNLWDYIPITDIMQPYYIKQLKGNIHVPK